MTKFLVNELTRLNSEASSLTAENFEDIVHQSPDNPTTWTNEKHNLYLDHLEVSFVKQLQQSMGLLASCSEQNKSEKHLSGKQHDCVYNSSDQDGCWQKINYGRGQSFLRTSADTLDALKSPRVQWFGRSCPPASAASQQNLVLCSTEKYIAMEGIGSQGSKTRSYQLPASNLYTECTGQNFVDGDGQNNSNNESRGQKVEKTALADNSNHDQIVPSWKCPTSDNSAIDGGEPGLLVRVSEKIKGFVKS